LNFQIMHVSLKAGIVTSWGNIVWLSHLFLFCCKQTCEKAETWWKNTIWAFRK